MRSLYRFLLSSILLVASLCAARAQEECGTALDRATDLYENADFTEAIALLKPCLERGLSNEERWQGYRLLALSYLFLDDASSADAAIQKLLEINPHYQPNPGRDPVELIRPLQMYGIYPRFYAGVKGGLNYTTRQVTSHHVVSGQSGSARTARVLIGSDIGLTFDLGITPALSLATEMFYSTRTFGYTIEPQMTVRTEYMEDLSWLNIPMMVRYQFDDRGVRPFLYGGYFIQSLLSATSDYTATRIDPGADSLAARREIQRQFSDNGVRSTTDRRAGLNHGLVAGAGLYYPLGAGLLMIDLRYEHGLADVVKTEDRFTDTETLFRYLHVDDDFRLRSLGLQIGYVYQFGFTVYRK